MNLTDKQFQSIRIGLVLLGAGLIMFQYFVNRSMWTDESKLALNIINLNFLQLTQMLDYNQSAPILFLWLSKIFSLLFGNSDYSLRLTPLLLGLGTIPLFSNVLKELIKSKLWSLFGLSLFISNLGFIYFSTEFKQYIGDLFALVTMLYLVTSSTEIITRNRYLALGVIGFPLAFLSNATGIFMVVLGLWLLNDNFIKRKKTIAESQPLFLMLSLWFVVIVAYFFIVVHNNPLKLYMINFWEFSFPPQPFYSIPYFEWLLDYAPLQIVGVVNMPPALFYSLLILATAGNIIQRKWRIVYLVFTPIFIHLILAYFQLYPFFIRFLTYLIPLIILYFAIGLKGLTDLLIPYPKIRIGLAITFLLIPIIVIINSLIQKLPFQKEELRQAIEVVVSEKEPNELLYVYYGSIFGFQRYQSLYNIENYELGNAHRDTNQHYLNDLNKIIEEHSTVWFLFSHIYPWNGKQPEDEVMFEYLSKQGNISLDKHFKGSRVFLFERKKN